MGPALVDFGENDRPLPNVYRTQTNHSALFKAAHSLGEHVYRSMLTPRQRELLILRTSWKAQAGYAWFHHLEAGTESAGLTMADVDRVKDGPNAAGLTTEEAALLQAVDELLAEQFISEPTWARLASTLNVQQMMDVIYTVGPFTMTCMALNSFGVQLETRYEKYRE